MPLRLAVEFDATYLPGERREQHLALCAGHDLSQASVDPHPERKVPGRLARDVEPVGILPTSRIAVGRPEEDHHPVVLCYLDTREFGIVGRGAEELLHRALEAYRLLEYRPGQRRIGAQPFPLVRIGGQQAYRA